MFSMPTYDAGLGGDLGENAPKQTVAAGTMFSMPTYDAGMGGGLGEPAGWSAPANRGTTTTGTAMPQLNSMPRNQPAAAPMTSYGAAAPAQGNMFGGYGGGGSMTALPGMTTQMQSPRQQMPAMSQSYSAAQFPAAQQTFASPRAYGAAGGSLTMAPGGGSGRFVVGGGSGRFGVPQAARADRGATPTWNPPELRGVDAMSQQLMSPGGGSYTAAPGGVALGGQRGAPNVTTAGMPTPPQIVAQQTRYAAALDQQLADGVATLEKEKELEKQMLKFTCEKDIALFTNAATEKFVEQAELIDERTTFAVLELKKAAVERKLQLSAQANGLVLDYEMKSIQVEWQAKWNAFEATFAGQEQKLEAEFAKQVAIANSGTAYAGPTPVLR